MNRQIFNCILYFDTYLLDLLLNSIYFHICSAKSVRISGNKAVRNALVQKNNTHQTARTEHPTY